MAWSASGTVLPSRAARRPPAQPAREAGADHVPNAPGKGHVVELGRRRVTPRSPERLGSEAVDGDVIRVARSPLGTEVDHHLGSPILKCLKDLPDNFASVRRW